MVRKKRAKRRVKKRTRGKKRGKKKGKKRRTRIKRRDAGMTFDELMAVTEATSCNIMDLSGLEINDKQLLELMPYALPIFLRNKVISLNLSNNSITDIGPLDLIDLFVDLESLDLSNQTPSDKKMSLEPIKDFTSLQVLSISNANVVDIEPLRDLDNLKVLWLSGNDIQDYEPISKLKLQLSNDTAYGESYTLENDGKTPPQSRHAVDKHRTPPQSPHARQQANLSSTDALAVNLGIDVDGFNQFLSQQETDDYGGFAEEWETILDNYDIYLSSLQ
jgi:hypothetical protein